MLESIKNEIWIWDWRSQKVGNWKNNISITTLISRIERWDYKTKELELNLEIYNLETDSFRCPDLFQFLTHYKLVLDADLRYPIIINNSWQVIDGRHRICKAIITWKKKIKAIQILDSKVV